MHVRARDVEPQIMRLAKPGTKFCSQVSHGRKNQLPNLYTDTNIQLIKKEIKNILAKSISSINRLPHTIPLVPRPSLHHK